jgi:hypothetical protein
MEEEDGMAYSEWVDPYAFRLGQRLNEKDAVRMWNEIDELKATLEAYKRGVPPRRKRVLADVKGIRHEGLQRLEDQRTKLLAEIRVAAEQYRLTEEPGQ